MSIRAFLHGIFNNLWKPIRVDANGDVRVVLTSSDTGQSLPLDEITNALITIDAVHYEIHEGDTFGVSYKNADGAPIADNGTIIFILQTGSKFAHLIASAFTVGDGEIELRENVTITGGTAMTEHNHKRTSANSATVAVIRDPATIPNAGTLLEQTLIPGGDAGNSIGSTVSQRNEWILKTNTNYMLRLTNRAGQAKDMSMTAVWYEESSN